MFISCPVSVHDVGQRSTK